VTEAVIKLIERIIDLYVLILIINAILSWLIAFNVLNTQNRFVFSVLEFSYKLTDPPLNYIRKFIPNLGSVDISPIILILILWFIKDLI
jgi:YggT family protein